MLVAFGDTKVLCAASVTEGVPRWRKGSGLGWLTAEYAMLPSATNTRSDRESVKGRVGGRTHEICRLVGRALRACIDLEALGENTIALDCDVLQADGGTRTAAITGAYVALADAVHLAGRARAASDPKPLSCQVAAVSVGVVDGRVRLDLPYEEDSRAEVDTNVVATDTGTLIEVQGTGEGATFSRPPLDAMLDTALRASGGSPTLQAAALAEPYPRGRTGRGAAARHPQPGQARRTAADAGRFDGFFWSASPTCPSSRRRPRRARRSPRTRWPRPATPPPPPAAVGGRRLGPHRRRAERDARGVVGALERPHGADRANLELLLAQIADVPDERRGAAFVCAAALVVPGGPETVVHGEWPGASRGRRGAPTASATTRSSCRTGRRARRPSCRPTRRTRRPTGPARLQALLPHLRALA